MSILLDPEIIGMAGIVPVFDTPEQFGAYIKLQRANGRKLIQESGFQPR